MSEPSLPHDPDVEVGAPPPRGGPPAWALVFAGGTLGAGTRNALTLAFPTRHGLPFTVGVINVLGAFALGLLLEALARRGPDEGGRRTLRLLAGTGFLGGFTTYSSLTTDTARLLHDGRIAAGLVYGAASVLLGALATLAGIATGAGRYARGAS